MANESYILEWDMNEEELPLLADISSVYKFRVAGADAQCFLQTLSTGDVEALPYSEAGGTFCRALLLTSDAEIIDELLIVHTGPAEYVLIGYPDNAAEAFQWLSAHAGIEDDSGPVFPDLTITDETSSMACFAFYGSGTREVLAESAHCAIDDLPACSEATLISLENAPVLLLSEVLDDEECFYFILVPASYSEGIWNLLLSFPEVYIVEASECRDHLIAEAYIFQGIDSEAYQTPDMAHMTHLLRGEEGFVGARALYNERSDG